MTKPLPEGEIRAYLVKRVKAVGGEIRKVSWVGRNSAPDELVLLPQLCTPYRHSQHILTELKSAEAGPKFPSNPHEHAQAREHERLRKYGFRVEVIWSLKQIDELLEV